MKKNNFLSVAKLVTFFVVFASMLLVSGGVFAQNKSTEVTKFLGIPVDGTKTAMIQKLKAKGFTYDAKYDWLKGQFNGRDVTVHIITNNNKVYRIMVQDYIGSSEGEIKIRFNKLCRQFNNNDKYLPSDLVGDYELSESEDISYEMTVRQKRYQASYCQRSANDSIEIKNRFQRELQARYTQEQLDNADKKLSDELNKLSFDVVSDYIDEVMSKRSVWFMIYRDYLDYKIFMYYDNDYNSANGEDL